LGSGPDVEALAERLGHRFREPALLRQALAHRSWCAEHPGTDSNERLEFLGDAVLGWVVADLVYREHEKLPEGKLTDLRKAVVNASALADAAEEIGLGDALLLGKGEAAAGGRRKPSILSDALEAVFGAVYLDGGTGAAYDVIDRLIGPRIVDAEAALGGLDHKTNLQELSARLFELAPAYDLRESGPDHAKTFFADVRIDGTVWGRGEGRSKKLAEQAAAREACERLRASYPLTDA
jgi:ribonuclease III